MSPQFLPNVSLANEKEDGTTPAEYAVILALVMVACVAAVTIICGH
jgi:Flp pilus assembly pilin Flp